MMAAFLKWRGQDGAAVLLRALNGLQAARYLEITEANKSQRRFLFDVRGMLLPTGSDAHHRHRRARTLYCRG